MNNYDTAVYYHNKKSLNKKQYYNFYHDNFIFRKIENISLTQQTDITNNITETNNQTTTYADGNYLNDDKMATINIAPTSLTDNYIWIPETPGNVVPGLGSLLTYIQSKSATLTALQNSISNVNNTINNEIQTLKTETNNVENNPGTGNVSKEPHYHTSHTDFMYQRNNTKNDNRKNVVIQNHYFTFQRQYNTNHLDLQIQLMQSKIEQMQAQMNNLSSNNQPPDDSGIGTA